MLGLFTSLLGKTVSSKFLVTSTLVTVAVFVLLFVWSSKAQEQHIMDQVRKQAEILYKQVILTRHWVSDQGAILVPKREGIESSPFLEEPEVTSREGVVYTKVTPSILTKMLSERASQAGSYAFKLTNTVPLNEENAPDKVEEEALDRFKRGAQDPIFRTEIRDKRRFLRYVAPVYVNESCLQCHMVQGYRPGDVGGCLSVFVPMDDAWAAIRQNNIVLLGGSTVLASCLVLLLFLSSRSLVFKRIRDIKASVDRITPERLDRSIGSQGDELKEIADFCYAMDEEMKTRHEELERKIAEATHDLSEANAHLEALNQELQNLNRAKLDFFSDISHELRTPLTSIKGAVETLARKALCEEPIYIDIIKRNVDHLIKTVFDFLDYSKMEAGELELNLEPVSLKTVAEEALLAQQADAAKSSVELVLDATDGHEARIDKTRIYQVLTNLLSNAIRFSPAGDSVRVTITYHDGTATVCVQDNGPGIHRKYHEAIFRKFYQIPDQDGRKIHRGTSGIGLAICKGLVEAHKGNIWVESQPGKGSCFCFTLPLIGVDLKDLGM
ncbi:MAG: ATP-binding protein [Thermodesulfobacteriota bacterium]